MAKLIVADDHPLFRDALCQAIDAQVPSRAIETAGDLARVEELVGGAGEVDLILLDLAMPGSRGLSGLLRLRAEHAEIPPQDGPAQGMGIGQVIRRVDLLDIAVIGVGELPLLR